MFAFVFPGQGSQQKGMGETLFDEFIELTAQADGILGYSIKELCTEDPNSMLGRTQYTQPALYIVNSLSYLKKINHTGKKPNFVVGHSLGEYSALFAAGAFDFVTGLKLVKKRGELMSRATGGGMAAVIGLSQEQIEDVLKQNDLNTIDIANLNSPSQIVISGPKPDMDTAKIIFEKINHVKMFVPLKTSGAFHSRYMKQAEMEFEAFLNEFEFSDMLIPVISNVHARQYKRCDIKKNLVAQITNPVKWSESIRYLMGLGVNEFEEIGTGRVLTGLIQKIQKEAKPLVIEHLKECEEKAQQPQSIYCDIKASSLGNSEFKKDYNLKYAYLAGGMYRGVSSCEMVIKMGNAGMLGFLGTGGMELSHVEEAICCIQKELSQGQPYGINLVHNPNNSELEEKTIDLFLIYGIKNIEVAAFWGITPSLARYRAEGLARGKSGKVVISNKIIAKLSRPEVAEAFLSPAPQRVIETLLSQNKITHEQADLLRETPMADDICVEADSAGHTDGGVAYVLMPTIIKLRDEIMDTYKYSKKIRVGAAGGIGTPHAAVAAFMLGADFIMTGSINQCTVEAGTSDKVKDLLQGTNVQDTEYAPAGDMFELGSKVQVLKKGLFFPARANKLYELYRQYNSVDEIDSKIRKQIEERYFKRSFDEIYEDIKCYYSPEEIEKIERNPKHKMALIFRWYFRYSTRLALEGDEENKEDYQIPCGPALGSFNKWVKGTELENWRNRHVSDIGEKIMSETANMIHKRFKEIML